MQDRLRPGQNPNGDALAYRGIGFGMPGSIVDIITISLVVGFFNGLSKCCKCNWSFKCLLS